MPSICAWAYGSPKIAKNMIGKMMTGMLNAGTRMSRTNSQNDCCAIIGSSGASLGRSAVAISGFLAGGQRHHRLFQRGTRDFEVPDVGAAGEQRAQKGLRFGCQQRHA